MNDSTKKLGALVREARVSAGIETQAEFARRIRTDVRTVSRIETGVCKPSYDTLVAISRETKHPLEHFAPSESATGTAA